MAYQKKSFMEHTAIRVKDIHWHIRFFEEALGMPVVITEGPDDNPTQVWTAGGIQLVSDTKFEGSEGQLSHIGIMTEDMNSALKEVYRWNVIEMPQGRNWFALPDGVVIEILQAAENSINDALAVKFRD